MISGLMRCYEQESQWQWCSALHLLHCFENLHKNGDDDQ